MDWTELRSRCLSLPGATETFPFEPGVSVFKAPSGKVFAIATEGREPLDVSVKCDPDRGEMLRSGYESIRPGYHLDKRHWITVALTGEVPDALVGDLIQDSYDLVAGRGRQAPTSPKAKDRPSAVRSQ
jgi:predicted DNA-binding protein (MmcQ/YjbR family)